MVVEFLLQCIFSEYSLNSCLPKKSIAFDLDKWVFPQIPKMIAYMNHPTELHEKRFDIPQKHHIISVGS